MVERGLIKMRETAQGVIVSLARKGGTCPSRAGVKMETDRLSPLGARRIYDASLRAAALGQPFRAMWTLTVADRAPFVSGDLVLSREVRRFLNTLKSIGLDPGHYVWVVENPNGNLHAHLLVSLVIPRAEFRSVMLRIERVWGHGFVHAEHLRDHQASAAYILKACGYIGKGAGKAQGVVRGRRYGVSRSLGSDVSVYAEGDRERLVQMMREDRTKWHLRMDGYSLSDAVAALEAEGVLMRNE